VHYKKVKLINMIKEYIKEIMKEKIILLVNTLINNNIQYYNCQNNKIYQIKVSEEKLKKD
jgi:hypothetical protein